MSDRGRGTGWVFWLRWLVATAVGWVGGGLAAIVLSDLVVNLFYHRETNLIVGLCMGAAVAWLQRVAIRRSLGLAWSWVVGGAIMMAPPFVAHVVLRELSMDVGAPAVRLAIFWIAVVGGLVGAMVQARALRDHTPRWAWWVVAIGLAWAATLAASPVTGMLGGGIVLGAVGGGLLVLLLRAQATPLAA